MIHSQINRDNQEQSTHSRMSPNKVTPTMQHAKTPRRQNNERPKYSTTVLGPCRRRFAEDPPFRNRFQNGEISRRESHGEGGTFN